MSAHVRWASVALALGVVACGGAAREARPSPAPAASSKPPPPPAPPDALGDPPAVSPAAPFRPQSPVVYATASGMTVWLLERHTLPVVAATIVVPTGASSDPKGEAGLADQATQMLSEGAGARDALAFARAVDELGATLSSGASLDASHVQLSVVKRRFADALQLLGDAVVRPRWDPAEWRRLHELWVNELKERASDPEAVADVVASSVLYGAESPYGHPAEGLLTTAPRLQLSDAKRFWAQAWRPDRATLVVVGDMTKEELDPLLAAAFDGWKAPSSPPPPSSLLLSKPARREAGPRRYASFWSIAPTPRKPWSGCCAPASPPATRATPRFTGRTSPSVVRSRHASTPISVKRADGPTVRRLGIAAPRGAGFVAAGERSSRTRAWMRSRRCSPIWTTSPAGG